MHGQRCTWFAWRPGILLWGSSELSDPSGCPKSSIFLMQTDLLHRGGAELRVCCCHSRGGGIYGNPWKGIALCSCKTAQPKTVPGHLQGTLWSQDNFNPFNKVLPVLISEQVKGKYSKYWTNEVNLYPQHFTQEKAKTAWLLPALGLLFSSQAECLFFFPPCLKDCCCVMVSCSHSPPYIDSLTHKAQVKIMG